MRSTTATHAVLFITLMSVSVGPAVAELPGGAWKTPVSVDARVVFKSWTIKEPGGETDLRQLAFPLFVQTRLRDDLEFSYLFTAASSRLGFAGSGSESGEAELNGVADGKLAVTYYRPDSRFFAGGAVRVPSGTSALTIEEEAVARVLIDRILGFHVKRYGEGPDLEMRWGYASTLGAETALSGGISFVFKGAFDVLVPGSEEPARYQPGNEVALFGAARGMVGERLVRARVRYARYAVDRRDDAQELQEGQEVVFGLGVVQETLRAVIDLDLEAVLKKGTRLFGTDEPTPFRDVGGNILRAGLGVTGAIDTKTNLGVRVDAGLFDETRTGTGDGFVTRIGPRLVRELGGRLQLEGAWQWMLGRAENGSIDLNGQALVVGIGWGDRR